MCESFNVKVETLAPKRLPRLVRVRPDYEPPLKLDSARYNNYLVDWWRSIILLKIWNLLVQDDGLETSSEYSMHLVRTPWLASEIMS